MDINIALTRAGIFISVFSFTLGIPFWLGYTTKSWFPATTLAVVLATAGPFIYTYLRKRAEDVILKEQKAYQQSLREISSTMMLIKELDRLLKTIVLKVVDTVKVSWAGIYLKDEKQNKYLLKHQRVRGGAISLPENFPLHSSLVTRLRQVRLPSASEEISTGTPENDPILKAGLAVPCFIDENMLGFLLLGDKPKGALYTQDDINTFALLANQTALAIENCQFYSQERQREHFRRIATLDHQIDCMAHEIDNPIHAILGTHASIEMSLDTLKDIIPQDKFEYLKTKIQRASFNAKRITKMIGAVKEFSKPTTGELSCVSLKSILDDFGSIMYPQFKHHGVNFTQSVPEENLWLRANKVELEQVLVNLATNSIQAINEIWQAGRNTPENKKEVSLKVYELNDSTLRIDLSDTGSGIKKELLEDIFLDFVTTKASSVGTGLGLAIARKIITRHKGRIWAESEGEDRGASFRIELPIASGITEEEIKKAEKEQQDKEKRIMF